MTRPPYLKTQPRRCAGEAAGLTGICLACGQKPDGLCRAPAADRYRPSRP